MRLHFNTLKDKFISVGIISTFFLFISIVTTSALRGQHSLLIAVIFGSISIMLYRESNYGYSAAKFIIGLFAVLAAFAIVGLSLAHRQLVEWFIPAVIVIEIVLLFNFYSLEEHQKYQHQQQQSKLNGSWVSHPVRS